MNTENHRPKLHDSNSFQVHIKYLPKLTTLCNSKYDDIIIKLEINNRITLKFPNVCKLNNIFLNNTCESNKKLQYTLRNILNWMQIKIDSRAPYWKHLKVHQQGKKTNFMFSYNGTTKQ